jgi:hypothetical protein
MNRLDHFVWVVHAENIEQYVHELSELFDVEFDYRDGPRSDGTPLQTYVAWDAGLEVIAPFADPDARPIAEHPVARRLAAHLEEHGEGAFGVVVRVPSLAGATDRAARLGWEVDSVAPHLADKSKRMAVHAAWTTKILDIQESFVGKFLNTMLIVGEFEYPGEAT